VPLRLAKGVLFAEEAEGHDRDQVAFWLSVQNRSDRGNTSTNGARLHGPGATLGRPGRAVRINPAAQHDVSGTVAREVHVTTLKQPAFPFRDLGR
jgi:hypothetical protein